MKNMEQENKQKEIIQNIQKQYSTNEKIIDDLVEKVVDAHEVYSMAKTKTPNHLFEEKLKEFNGYIDSVDKLDEEFEKTVAQQNSDSLNVLLSEQEILINKLEQSSESIVDVLNDELKDVQKERQEFEKAVRTVKLVLTPQVKEQYLSEFEGLSKEDVNKKSSFFDRTVTFIAKKLLKKWDNGEIENPDTYIKSILSNVNMYSRINKAVNKIENKNMIFNRQGPNMEPPQSDNNEGDEDVIDMVYDAETNTFASKDDDNNAEKEMSEGEKLEAELNEARTSYAKVHYKHETMMSKVKGFFNRTEVEENGDVEITKNAYKEAIMKYREAKMRDMDSLTDEQKQELLKELKFFDLNEKINLYDERINVKSETIGGKIGQVAQSETIGGKIGQVAHKAIIAYKKMPMKYKMAISGAMFIGGVATGTGAAAGFFAGLSIGKRMLRAASAGVGAVGFAEALAQKKEQSNIQEQLETFKKLTIEQQIAQLETFDDKTFEQLNKEFQSKISGRLRRVTLGVSVAAGMMAIGSIGNVFGGTGTGEGSINSELINKEASQAFGHYQLDNELPDINEQVASVSGNKEVYDSFRDATATISQQKMEMATKYANELSNVSETDRDKMEEYLISLAQKSTDNNGFVNEELLKQEANRAFEQYQFNGEIPNGNEMVDADALDSSGVENIVHSSFQGIELNSEQIGSLSVTEKGIEGPLAQVLAQNSDKLTEGGMGWNSKDPRWGGDVMKWAQARAHGIVAEKYSDIFNGVDKHIPAGTTFEVDFSNPADIRLDPGNKLESVFNSTEATIDSDDVDVLGQMNKVDAKIASDVGVENSVEPNSVIQGTTNTDIFESEPGDKVIQFREMTPQQKVLRIKSLAEAMGIENAEGNFNAVTQGGVITEINGHPVPENLFTNEEKMQIEDARKIRRMMDGGGEVSSVSVPMEEGGLSDVQDAEEVLKSDSGRIIRRAENADMFDTPTIEEHIETTDVNEVAKRVGAEFKDYITNVMGEDLLKNPNFANTAMTEFMNNDEKEGVAGKIHDIMNNAKEVFGAEGEPKENEVLSKYLRRIFVKASVKGNVEEIFEKK